MDRSDPLVFARARLDVARAGLQNLLLDYPPDHPRVRDARENVGGWTRELERLERAEDARLARLVAGEAVAWGAAPTTQGDANARSESSAPAANREEPA